MMLLLLCTPHWLQYLKTSQETRSCISCHSRNILLHLLVMLYSNTYFQTCCVHAVVSVRKLAFLVAPPSAVHTER
jgi:hypothetical protein